MANSHGSSHNLTGADPLAKMTATVGGLVPTPPNDATKYLDGTGAFTVPPAGVTATGPSTWTPVDSSGASLTLTVTNAVYYNIGKMFIILFDITYPVTASGANGKIGGLPGTSYNTSASDFTGGHFKHLPTLLSR